MNRAMLDIDDTLIQFNLELVRFLNNRFNRNIKFDDLRDYDLIEAFNVTGSEMDDAVNAFYLSKEHESITVMPQAEVVLNILFEKEFLSDLVLVTSRNEKYQEITLNLLKKVFPTGILDNREMYMLGHFDRELEQSKKRCKSEICKELGLSIAFEDNVNHAKALARVGCTVYMIKSPWNEDFDEDEFNLSLESEGMIIKCRSWLEILSNVNREEFIRQNALQTMA